MLRRHPILFLTSLGLLLLFVMAGYYLATFDLSNYRHQLAQRLSANLQTPVSLGDAQLSLTEGLTLSFSKLLLGDGQSALKLQAERLSLQLQFMPLLKRQLIFSGAILEKPEVIIRSFPAKKHEQEEDPLALFRSTQLHSLKIRNGRITLPALWQEDGKSKPLTLRNTQVQLDKAGSQTLHLTISSQLFQSDRIADLELSGALKTEERWLDWSQWQAELEGRVGDLDVQSLGVPAVSPEMVQGKTDVDLALRGSMRTGFDLQARLDPSRLNITGPEKKTLTSQKVSLQTRWRWTDGTWTLTLENITVDRWQMRGPMTLSSGPEHLHLSGKLSADPLALGDLAPWYTQVQSKQRDLPPLPSKGTVSLNHCEIAGPFTKQLSQVSGWMGPRGIIRSFDLDVKELRLDTPAGPFHQGTMRLFYENDILKLEKGSASLQTIPFKFEGRATDIGTPGSFFEIQGSAITTADSILDLSPEFLPDALSLEGKVAANFKVSGGLAEQEVKLNADFSDISATWQEMAKKNSDTPTSLELTGHHSGSSFIFRSIYLNLAGMKAHGRGNVLLETPYQFDLDVEIPPLELAKLERLLPTLANFQLRGVVQGDLRLSGTREGVSPPEGRFALSEGGARFDDIVGDLNRTEGRIFLSGQTLRAPNLTTYLGKSMFQVTAVVPNLRRPRLEIDLEGHDLRPEDLVFHPGADNLQAVKGHMSIDGEGIYFSPVHAVTAGGTRATVTGAVNGYNRPHVDLAIDAEYGNVDEILDFFAQPAPENREEPTQSSRTTLTVRVDTEAGRFHHIEFDQAQAVISYRDNVLDIYPLHADLEPGYYVGRVVWAHSPGSLPLLKVSGHLEDVDAEEVNRTQTELPGLITGKLRGDFYLEGNGKNFVPTSRGGFFLEARDGVLRKFQVLSKVFSLLNVAQIFSFQLPDMSREGMPYNKITANLRLEDGILESDDLLVDSNAINLSVVGEIDLVENDIDAILGIKPLRTVDTLISKIPVAGWLLAGEDKALITAHFRIRGRRNDPEVDPIPVTSISEQVLGIFKRVLGLPGKVISDFGKDGEGESLGP